MSLAANTSLSLFSILAFILSVTGFILSAASHRHHRVNAKCALSFTLLFIALMIGTGAMSLFQSGGILSRPIYFAMLVAASIHCISGILSLIGIREMRRRRKWQKGNGRAAATLLTNCTALGLISTYYYLRLNPHILEEFLR